MIVVKVFLIQHLERLILDTKFRSMNQADAIIGIMIGLCHLNQLHLEFIHSCGILIQLKRRMRDIQNLQMALKFNLLLVG